MRFASESNFTHRTLLNRNLKNNLYAEHLLKNSVYFYFQYKSSSIIWKLKFTCLSFLSILHFSELCETITVYRRN